MIFRRDTPVTSAPSFNRLAQSCVFTNVRFSPCLFAFFTELVPTFAADMVTAFRFLYEIFAFLAFD